MKYILILICLSITAQAQYNTAKYAKEVPQPDEYWALSKDSVTWLQGSGNIILHLEATDTSTWVYQVYKFKKVWEVNVPTVKIEAESYGSQVNVEKVGTYIRPAQGWLNWSATYNVTLSGQKTISITYFNGNTSASTVVVKAGSDILGTFSLTPSASWTTSKTLTFPIPAKTGAQVINLAFTTGINFDYFSFGK